mgnify:CR=1 FL=1
MTNIEKINIELKEIFKILTGSYKIPPLKYPLIETSANRIQMQYNEFLR